MSGREAWPHQTRAIDMLRRSLASGKKRPMLQLATGGGKTFIASEIFRMAREKGKRCLFVVDALSLIDQTVQAFYGAGVHGIGVIQGIHAMTDWSKPVQIASVQTLQRRKMPRVDLVVVDEAHRQNRWLIDKMASEEWAKVPFIGLSATPWSRGLGLVYDDLIIAATTSEMIEAGVLSPFRAYAAAHPDLTGVKTMAGDYHEGQLAEVMGDGGLVADIVETWAAHGEGRPTLAFCVDRAHAAKVQAKFNGAGIPCGYIDAYTEVSERNAIRKRLDDGELKVVANVGCLTTGVDWAIGCIILARPTKSEMLYVQMVGRGLRVNPGMEDCIILDHADNTLRMGFVTDIHRPMLCTGKKGERAEPKTTEPLPKECPKCTFLKPPKTQLCPACGFETKIVSDINEHAGRLVQVAGKQRKVSQSEKQLWYSGLLHIQNARGYKNRWADAQYRSKFGVWPKGLSCFSSAPTEEISNWVRSRMIAFAKKRAA